MQFSHGKLSHYEITNVIYASLKPLDEVMHEKQIRPRVSGYYLGYAYSFSSWRKKISNS